MQNDWASWVTAAVQAAQAPLFPPQVPQVTTIGHPNAVQVIWNEVGGASSYAAYEVATATTAPGVPFTTVPANTGAFSNSVLRPNITDTTTRFYIVVAISPNARSSPSTPVAGTALSGASATVTISQAPINQGGVGGGVGGGGGITGITGRLQTR